MGCIKSILESPIDDDGEEVELSDSTGARNNRGNISAPVENPISKPSPSKGASDNRESSHARESEAKTDRSAARQNLKNLLHKDVKDSDSRSRSSTTSSASSFTKTKAASSTGNKIGKCGWLYRKNEDFTGDGDQFIQLWAVLAENKLQYYSQKPVPQTSSSAGEEQALPRGYLLINRGGVCKLADEHNIKGGVALSGQGRNCFLVTEPPRSSEGGAPISVIFSGTSDSDRYDWMEKLIEAFDGTKHEYPVDKSSPSKPAAAVSAASPSQKKEAVVEVITQAELPKITGPLKKKAVGGSFGIKTVKNRFFKLEAGELRYYEGEQMKPSQLKGTVQIKGCKMIPDKDKKSIVVEMPDGKRLEMEAADDASAKRWSAALEETISILSGSTTSSGGGAKKDKKRRDDIVVERINEKVSPSKSAAKDPMSFKTEATKSFLQNSLQDHFLLGGLDDFDPLIDALKLSVGLPGDVVIWQDTVGDLFYVLESGTTQVVKAGNVVGNMVPGTAFGELALINDVKRAATIRVDTISRLWSLDRATFRRVLANQESISKEEKMSFLRNIKIFEKLHDLSLAKVADALNVARFQAGAKIFKQGDIGNCLYVVHRGTVQITQVAGGTNKELARLSTGMSFGELALIQDEPRKATAIAVDKVVCYTLDRVNFTSILGDFSSAVDENVGILILKKVKILKDLNDNQLQGISRRLTRRVYGVDKVIIKQGDDGNSFFMIATGEVSVIVNDSEVASLAAGAYFGEMALMNSEKRNATIVAKSETTCLILERNDFIELLGPLERIMQDEARRRAASSAGGGGFFSKLSTAFSSTPQTKKNPTLTANVESGFKLSDFEIVCVIGRGKFGLVNVVLDPTTDNFYAMKIVEKEKVMDFGMESQIFEIRDLCADLINPLIPKLYSTYSDPNSLFMLHELVPGGDFWTLLYDSDNLDTTPLGGISSTSAMFYGSNVLAAFSYLHERGIAYRCLKPENVVLDARGYLKLTDFMCAKRLIGSDSATTMCGNPEYISPEMVLSKPHNRAVDMWALGIFLFELLTRSTPFDHPTTAGIYQRVLASTEYLSRAFKAGFHDQGRDLINQLLNGNPAVRLGMLRNGTDDVWNHQFFKGLTLNGIEQMTRAAPYIPKIPEGDVIASPADIDLEEEPEPRRYSGKFDFSGF